MIGEIGTAIGALKSAFELSKTIADVGGQVALNETVIRLQGQILAAQAATMSTQERIQELEATVSKLQSWEHQASRYKLVDYGTGTFAWELKPESASGEPIHRCCPNCFEERKRSILQFKGRTYASQDMFECVSCNKQLFFGAFIQPDEPRISRSRNSFWDE